MSKKIYAVMDCDESPVEYLTAGKEYLTRPGQTHRSFEIDSDKIGDPGSPKDAYCLWHGCAHLNGGNWRRIEREEGE